MKDFVFDRGCKIEAVGMEEVNGGGDIANLANVEVPVEDPKNCFDGTTVAKAFLSLIDWTKAETRGETGREYKTTTAHNITLQDEKYTYQFGLSCNRKPKRNAAPEGMTAREAKIIAEANKVMTQVAKRQGKDVQDIALEQLANLK